MSETGTVRISVDGIADRAGVSPASVYRHFGSKQALIDEVSVDRWRRAAGWAAGSGRAERALIDIVTTLDRFSLMVADDSEFIAAAGVDVGQTPVAILPVRREFAQGRGPWPARAAEHQFVHCTSISAEIHVYSARSYDPEEHTTRGSGGRDGAAGLGPRATEHQFAHCTSISAEIHVHSAKSYDPEEHTTRSHATRGRAGPGGAGEDRQGGRVRRGRPAPG
nr:TetR/AcrR family transcriptional regulator [Microbacterium bovistercoris]